MLFTAKTIADLQSELRKNPFDLEKMTELYTAYASTGNKTVLLEIAEARYKIFTKRYPGLSAYLSMERYTEKDYFESINRVKLENVFLRASNTIAIQFFNPQKNPENSFSQIYHLHSEFWGQAATIVTEEREITFDEIERLKQVTFSAIKTLGQLFQDMKVLNSLTVENFDKQYSELLENMNYLLIAAQTKRKLILLKEIINYNGFPDADIVDLVESTEELKKLLK